MSVKNLDEFSDVISKIIKTDRWVLIVVDGDMGEGKSCFATQLSKKVADKLNTPFTYNDNISFLRSEVKLWIDGDAKGNKRKPEYSVLLADELISMFFKRNWYDSDQIDGIELLNKCRDRHMCVIGNIPNFWDLDSAIYPIVTFRIHVYERGIAWVFAKSRNAWTKDKWYFHVNEKQFDKTTDPRRCKGFVCSIPFSNWSDSEKKDYYEVRNTKRKNSEGQRSDNGKFRIKKLLRQRDNCIIALMNHTKLKYSDVREFTGLSETDISEIYTAYKETIQEVVKEQLNPKFRSPELPIPLLLENNNTAELLPPNDEKGGDIE